MFIASFGTFLLSKEILVMEHEFWCGLALFFVLGQLVKKAGPMTREMVEKDITEQENKLKGARLAEIQR